MLQPGTRDHHFPKDVIQKAGELGFVPYTRRKIKAVWAYPV